MADSRNGYSIDRRTVLQGAGAMALAGITVSSTTVSADQHEEGDQAGMLVIIYDDSPREDYTKAFPVHQEYDVPGCAAVCPGIMGTHSSYLHPDHLEEMYNAGWEVMSHTLRHRGLGEVPIRGDIEEGDTRIRVQSNIHGQYEGDPLLVFNEEKQTTVTVAGRESDGEGQFLLLDEPIDESFSARAGHYTWVRYTDEFTENVLSESKERIEDWGLGPVTSYVHPFNRYDGIVSQLVPEYYDAVPNRHEGGLNPTDSPNPFELSRVNFQDDSVDESDLEEFYDEIADGSDFGIIYGHTTSSAFTQDRIAAAIELAQDRNLEIVTLHDALDRLGVLGDDPEPEDDGEPDEDDSPPTPDDDEALDDDNDGLVDGIANQVQSGVDWVKSVGQDLASWIGNLWPF